MRREERDTRTSQEVGRDSAVKKSISNKQKVDDRLAEGRKRGEEMYGMSAAETGGKIQDVLSKRESMLDGKDPVSDSIRQQRNRRLAMAEAQGVTSQGQKNQIGRQAEQDISASMYNKQYKDLGAFQKLMGNVAAGQTSLEMGYGALGSSEIDVGAPKSSGLFGTVVCTELYSHGYMSLDLYRKDHNYGIDLLKSNPDVYFGYRFIAKPFVYLMKKSTLFTKIISYPTLKWANHIAGNKNITGWLINSIGTIICSFIGKLITNNTGVRDEN